MSIAQPPSPRRFNPFVLIAALCSMLASGGVALGQVDISTRPVSTSQTIPGNLLLVPSVEWPTINSVANLGAYDTNKTYAGYFDSDKCYRYEYSSAETERHFEPAGAATDHTCSGYWSGHFLNWAATQTIDPFRSALTGGYRVVDRPDETWLEKARHDGQGGTSIYPNLTLPESSISGATPFSGNALYMRIQGLGNKMRFRLGNTGVDYNVTAYTGSGVRTDRAYELSVRVKVCDPSVGVESNCKQYSQGWKPEGTIQEYASSMRYGIFGYLNDSNVLRDGGVLRAQQKWVGPTMKDTNGNDVANSQREWDATTGVFVRNPDSSDATNTGAGILDSGVINYLNKFGEMTTLNHKSIDPVSELYYAALRYYRNLGDISAYSNLTVSGQTNYETADGFPVITNWDDPIIHWCQKNTILGIGDIYTHRDKNLNGSPNHSEEPPTPSEVTADTVNTQTATQKVAQLEGITISLPFTGRNNSAFIAGLAYDAHTTDIRPDLTQGMTTVSTYWVDVLEAQSLEGMARNQYALAAKYGGFRVPDNFDPYARTAPLEDAWYNTSGDTLTPFGSRGSGQATFKRPDNYFVAGEAADMVESLQKAFANIFQEMTRLSTSAAASSAILQSDTLLYTAGFRSNDWTGTLQAREIQPDGTLACLATSDCWDAEETLRLMTWSNRHIFTRAAATPSGAGGGVALTFANLNSAQQDALDHRWPDDTDDSLGAARVDWLKGRLDASTSLRGRSDSGVVRLLGDIVNSDPVLKNGVLYVGSNDGMLHAFDSRTGTELMAYVPSALLLPESGVDYAPVTRLTHPNYDDPSSDNHRYFVDGKLAVEDVYKMVPDGSGGFTREYHQILVGSLGAGGRSVFALDVTGLDTSGTPSFQASDVLWEFTAPELGFRIGTPVIARVGAGASVNGWAAIFGNGYNSDNHQAALLVVDLFTGALIETIDTGAGSAAAPNGLAGPAVTDWPTLNLVANLAYAGDLQGNLWRFDLSAAAPGSWTAQTLFTATAPSASGTPPPQPITTNPRLAVFPDDTSQIVVAFGTGSYFRVSDAGDTTTQSLYGILDAATARATPLTRADLLQQTFIDATLGVLSNTSMYDASGVLDYDGWYLDLTPRASERVVSEATFPSGSPRRRVRFTTMIPDADSDGDICTAEPSGYLYDIDLVSGGRTSYSVFDTNGDNEVDDQDLTGGGETVSVVEFGGGERATAVQDEQKDYIYDGDGTKQTGLAEDAGSSRQSWRQWR